MHGCKRPAETVYFYYGKYFISNKKRGDKSQVSPALHKSNKQKKSKRDS